MRVLMITGDKRIFVHGSEAHARFALQQAQVEALDVVFVGAGELGAKNPRRALRRGDLARSFLARAFAWRVARRRGAKLNIQVHADLSGQSLIKHVLAKIVLRHADSIRVVSEHIKHQVEKTGVRAPIRVLPVFIDIERFKNITPVPHDKKTILWIGRFEREKDPLQALAIYKSVLDAEVDAKLVLLGAGSLETDLRAKAAAIGGHVEFPGWRDPLPFLAEADVVLCTSRHESYGASIVEALVAGVAVVAPDVGIAREAGAIIAPWEHMAQKVMELLKNDARGALTIKLPNAQEYATLWRNTIEI